MIVIGIAAYTVNMFTAFTLGFICAILHTRKKQNGGDQSRKERKRKWDKLERWDKSEL